MYSATVVLAPTNDHPRYLAGEFAHFAFHARVQLEYLLGVMIDPAHRPR